jgi:hypothetical protein
LKDTEFSLDNVPIVGTHHFVEERDMGWLFKSGCSRRELIEQRTEDWERTNPDGVLAKTTCLAHCFRGGTFSGVLWTVWGRSFTKDGAEVQPNERWIGCDLLRSRKGFGWGYKDLDEAMGPYVYSCPLKYLSLVAIEKFGGNAEWRAIVHRYHQRQAEKRRNRFAVQTTPH